MEMDVCPESQAHSLAALIATFLETNVNREKEEESHVVSLKVRLVAIRDLIRVKARFVCVFILLTHSCIAYSTNQSSGKGNALTMSGALGASRERKPKEENKKKSDGDGNNKRDRSSDRRDKSQRGRGTTTDRRSGGGRGGRGRLTHNEAFERLSGGNGRNNDRRGGGRNDLAARPGRGASAGRGEIWRGGGGRNDGRIGRGGRGDPGPRGGRGSPRQQGGRGGGRNGPMSGNRRNRDEMRGDEDFIPAGRGGPRDGRFQGRDNRGGRRDGNRGGAGRRPDFEEGNKRQRTDEYGGWEEPAGGGYSEWGGGYDEGYNDYNWRGGGRRGGGRASRGRGRGRVGRGFTPEGVEPQSGAAEANGESGGDAAEAAAGHPSPLVAASFGGRGFRGRGRGRGRGARGGYRAQVASMIASKTWVRPKKEGEGGDAGDDGSKPNGNSATGGGEEM